jgi:hypothetical protein
MSKGEISKAERNAIALIKGETDPDALRRWIANGRREGSSLVEREAFERLCFIQPEATPGTVEHDVWQSIHALEEMLREERGKTVRLSRTRQKITRDGEAKTASDLTLKDQASAGFSDLIDRNCPELTFEAVVLRHPKTFDDEAQTAARSRLEDAGVNVENLINSRKEIDHG